MFRDIWPFRKIRAHSKQICSGPFNRPRFDFLTKRVKRGLSAFQRPEINGDGAIVDDIASTQTIYRQALVQLPDMRQYYSTSETFLPI